METLGQEGKAREGTLRGDATSDPKATDDSRGLAAPGKAVSSCCPSSSAVWCCRQVLVTNSRRGWFQGCCFVS